MPPWPPATTFAWPPATTFAWPPGSSAEPPASAVNPRAGPAGDQTTSGARDVSIIERHSPNRARTCAAVSRNASSATLSAMSRWIQ